MLLRTLLCTAMLSLVLVARVSALQPMNPTTVQQALSFGNAAPVTSLIRNPEWYKEPQADNPWEPTFTIETPFFMAAFAKALANQRYKEISKEEMHELKNNATLTFLVTLISRAVSGNDGARCVLKQNGHVIQPTNVSIGFPDVTEMGEDADYRRSLTCDFSIHSFDYKAPFTLTLANIDTVQIGIERDYDIDPSTFR